MNALRDPLLSLAEQQWLTPPEPQDTREVGRCEVCGWPIYDGEDYVYDSAGCNRKYLHVECKQAEKGEYS